MHSPEDHNILEQEYKRNSKPDKIARLEIVEKVKLSEKEVQIWFQNKRQSARRKSRPLLPHELEAFGLGGMTALSSDPISSSVYGSSQAMSPREHSRSDVSALEPLDKIQEKELETIEQDHQVIKLEADHSAPAAAETERVSSHLAHPLHDLPSPEHPTDSNDLEIDAVAHSDSADMVSPRQATIVPASSLK